MIDQAGDRRILKNVADAGYLGLLLCAVVILGTLSWQKSEVATSPHGEYRYLQADNKKRAEEGKEPFWTRTADDPTALFTFWLTAFTAVLAVSTIGLWVVTYSNAKLARSEFLSTHRPRIIVHKFEFTTNPQKRVTARFTYVNAGATPATVTQIGWDMFFGEVRARNINVKTQAFDTVLAPGKDGEFTINSDVSDLQAYLDTVKGKQGSDRVVQGVMCVGYVRYADEMGTERETGFCRAYDPTDHTWVRIENTDYEYSY